LGKEHNLTRVAEVKEAASMESKNRDRGEGLDGRIEDIEANRRQDDKAKTGMG
jgi:hypothetical protein